MSSDQKVRHYTAADLAARWAVAPWAIYQLVRTGRVPYLRIGKRLRFRLEDIEQYERSIRQEVRA